MLSCKFFPNDVCFIFFFFSDVSHFESHTHTILDVPTLFCKSFLLPLFSLCSLSRVCCLKATRLDWSILGNQSSSPPTKLMHEFTHKHIFERIRWSGVTVICCGCIRWFYVPLESQITDQKYQSSDRETKLHKTQLHAHTCKSIVKIKRQQESDKIPVHTQMSCWLWNHSTSNTHLKWILVSSQQRLTFLVQKILEKHQENYDFIVLENIMEST